MEAIRSSETSAMIYHGVTSQKTVIFTVMALIISNLA
jgi:hypothetical protein